MKSIYLFGCAAIFSLNCNAQNSHVISAVNFEFIPAVLTGVIPGDTIFLETTGFHSITEVDQENWENNDPESNGGFWIGAGASDPDDWFIIEEEGVYYYMCMPHGTMGMKGTIQVTDPTLGVDDASFQATFTISPAGTGIFNLQFSNSDAFAVFATNGQQHLIQQLDVVDQQAQVNLSHLAAGTYMGVFMKNGELQKAVRFVR